MRDCRIVEALRTYLELCEGSDDSACGTGEKTWAANAADTLVSGGTCPESGPVSEALVPAEPDEAERGVLHLMARLFLRWLQEVLAELGL